jgi:hypothetical protein
MAGYPDPDVCSRCGNRFPAGQACASCAAEQAAPDLEEILRQVQGISQIQAEAIDSVTALHRRWFEAWTDKGFTPGQAIRLLEVIVREQARI